MEILQRNKRETASEYAKRVLEYQIVHMKLKPGEQLQEMVLAEQLGISRTPVREAILDLKRRNMIDIFPQHGTFVSYMDYNRIEEIRYLRYVFEADLMMRAAEIRTQADLMALYENVQLQKLYIMHDHDRFLQLDEEFHGIIYAFCGYEGLYSMIRQYSIDFDRMKMLSYDLESSRELIDAHEQMVQAIEARDGEKARLLLQEHLARAVNDYKSLRKKHPECFKPE